MPDAARYANDVPAATVVRPRPRDGAIRLLRQSARWVWTLMFAPDGVRLCPPQPPERIVDRRCDDPIARGDAGQESAGRHRLRRGQEVLGVGPGRGTPPAGLAHLAGEAVAPDVGQGGLPAREPEAQPGQRIAAADPTDQPVGLLPPGRLELEHPALARGRRGRGRRRRELPAGRAPVRREHLGRPGSPGGLARSRSADHAKREVGPRAGALGVPGSAGRCGLRCQDRVAGRWRGRALDIAVNPP